MKTETSDISMDYRGGICTMPGQNCHSSGCVLCWNVVCKKYMKKCKCFVLAWHRTNAIKIFFEALSPSLREHACVHRQKQKQWIFELKTICCNDTVNITSYIKNRDLMKIEIVSNISSKKQCGDKNDTFPYDYIV